MKTSLKFFKTVLCQSKINQVVEMEVVSLGNNNYELPNGSIIHIFDKVPFMRNIQSNKSWFNSAIFHFIKVV